MTDEQKNNCFIARSWIFREDWMYSILFRSLRDGNNQCIIRNINSEMTTEKEIVFP